MENSFVPERQQYSIVLIGHFNPAMFHPDWFCKNEIISAEDAATALNEDSKTPLLLSNQLTMFNTTQFYVKIEPNRFQLVADKEPLDTLKDFIINTLACLGSTDIRAYGYNYSAHYAIPSDEMYQMIGDNLAPKKYWGMLLGDEVTGVKRKSGLIGLQMQKTKEDERGKITLTFQPSAQLKRGVFIACNNHNVMKDDENSAEYVLKQINTEFKDAMIYMKDLQLNLMDEVTK